MFPQDNRLFYIDANRHSASISRGKTTQEIKIEVLAVPNKRRQALRTCGAICI